MIWDVKFGVNLGWSTCLKAKICQTGGLSNGGPLDCTEDSHNIL
jgi:hypothetical protein